MFIESTVICAKAWIEIFPHRRFWDPAGGKCRGLGINSCSLIIAVTCCDGLGACKGLDGRNDPDCVELLFVILI